MSCTCFHNSGENHLVLKTDFKAGGSGRGSALERWWVHGPVVIDVWLSADAILESDVQVIPEAAMQHHVPHHTDPVLQL